LERIDPDEDGPLVEQMLTILRDAGNPKDAVDWCELVGLVPMRAVGKCTRAMIVAKDGHELIGCDYSQRRGRVARRGSNDERWKIEAFKAYDAGTGPDLYKLAYSKSFGEPVESIGKGPKRQIGKVQELSLGYQGAVGAFMNMGANYGVQAGQPACGGEARRDRGRVGRRCCEVRAQRQVRLVARPVDRLPLCR
jgi:hypothetical protein